MLLIQIGGKGRGKMLSEDISDAGVPVSSAIGSLLRTGHPSSLLSVQYVADICAFLPTDLGPQYPGKSSWESHKAALQGVQGKCSVFT